MYCYNCDTFFPDADAVKKRDGETALHIFCCPHCGVDDLGESSVCEHCGREFIDDEIASGYCLECLWNAIDYDTALEFLEESDQLTEFMLTRMGAGKLEHSSPEFDAFMEETFRREVANDKLTACFVGETAFLKECRYWIIPNYYKGDFGFGCEFAEWYADRMKKEKQENRS